MVDFREQPFEMDDWGDPYDFRNPPYLKPLKMVEHMEASINATPPAGWFFW